MSDARSADIETLAILPLRNSVVFPASVVPINVGRPRSVRLVEEPRGAGSGPSSASSASADAEIDEPRFEDLYQVGTVARVVKAVLRLGPGNYSVVLHGLARFQVVQQISSEPYMRAKIRRAFPRTLDRDAEARLARGEPARGDAARARSHAEPPAGDGGHPRQRARERRAGRPHRLEPGPRAGQRVGQAEGPRKTFAPKARVRGVLAIVNRQPRGLLRVKKEVSLDDGRRGEGPARADPPPADAHHQGGASARSAKKTISTSCASVCARPGSLTRCSASRASSSVG